MLIQVQIMLMQVQIICISAAHLKECSMVYCRVSSYFGCWSLERGARSIAIVQILQHAIGLVKCIINIELQFSSIDIIFRTAFNLDVVLLIATALGIIANCLLLYGVM